MSTVSARRRALRGTKRTCQQCEARFYDLARSPIVCPMCGAHYILPPEPIAQASARVAPFQSKTGWRRGRAQPVLPVVDPEQAQPPGIAPIEDETEEDAISASEDAEDNIVPEQDDSDILGVIDDDAADATGP
ncbi:MAG: TIGR02300 family protein [Bacteroidota bacterium]